MRDEGRETNSSQTPEGEYMEEWGGGENSERGGSSGSDK